MATQLTAAGLEIDSFETIRDQIITDLRAISPILDCSPQSVLGEIVQIFAERERAVLELIQAVYGAAYPDTATGFSLRAICALSGTYEDPATKSTVTATCNVDAGTYAIGTLVAHVAGDPTSRFVNSEACVNPGPGAANIATDFEAETAGPVQALSGTLTVIAAPVVGWNSVTNPLDAVEGDPQETDVELRLRRVVELQRGSCTVGAVLSAVSDLDGIAFVTVLELLGTGTTPNSIWTIVHRPGATPTNQQICQAIYDNKAAGIDTTGTTTLTVQDEQGIGHQISFSHAQQVQIWASFNVTTDSTYPGDAAFEAAIVAWADAEFGVGDDIIYSRVLAAAFSVPGVTDCTLTLDIVNPPVATVNIPIYQYQIGVFDTSRITVT